ncbi:unnamed protein product [Closterium sp. NIES-65]|nr:unnamed protein product [Closterium sp. NIES-65]
MKLDAESSKEGDNATGTQPVQSTTVHTLLRAHKGMPDGGESGGDDIPGDGAEHHANCTDRRCGTIGDTYTAEQFRQIMFRVLPTWAAKAWNPRGTGPSQTLWRFLLLKVLTLLSHHSLLRGASIREITLPDIFLYRLASTSSVNPENQPVVMAGYSGYKQDYFLGRSRVEPSDKLLKLLAEHIFPGVDDMLKTAEGKAAEGSDADKAAVHFWRTLAMLRRIVAEDLAVKLVRTPWHRIAEPGFIDRHTLLAGATQGALNKRVRRMLKVIDAVRQLRASDGEADSEAVVDTLHRIAASGIGTFADALTVLKPGTAPMLSKEAGMGVKGLGPKVVSKLRLACVLVALNLKQSDWVETLFPNTWEEQMPKTKADLAKPTAPAKSTAPAKPTAPVHRPPTKRKKSA